jgi:hypothetical protein
MTIFLRVLTEVKFPLASNAFHYNFVQHHMRQFGDVVTNRNIPFPTGNRTRSSDYPTIWNIFLITADSPQDLKSVK